MLILRARVAQKASLAIFNNTAEYTFSLVEVVHFFLVCSSMPSV